MGLLVIDGNSVFEIDEECIKKRKPQLNCDVEKYLKKELDINIEEVYSKKTVE